VQGRPPAEQRSHTLAHHTPHHRGTLDTQVCAGEEITGKLTCAPNANNPRDLDITLEYNFEGQHCEAHRTQHYRMR
jgi:hypothetical protein